MSSTKNKLGRETSPYLLQHAHNPVHWYPWGPEALDRAHHEDKPILLSIGYSACHWCHVMAHESFEDEKTAALLNQYFINIKVDREERPDLDKIYQLSHQAMTGRGGGWPLTLVLSPEDQIGGGFCRYSTDELWMIPHFEKMLYDNGQLMPLYCWAQQIRPDYYFEQAVTRTASWLMQEMQAPEGGYYSAQDADSEGEEGKFYSWTGKQLEHPLSAEEYSVFSRSLGLDRKANFEGKWYPHTYLDIEQLARQNNQSRSGIQSILDRCKQKLYQHRQQRVYPGTDDKILTSWNALMIRGMNTAARTFNRPDYAESATQALNFIRQTHWRGGRLLATSKNAKAHLNAYLDDYAYLVLAIVDALQNEWDNGLYDWAIELTDTMLALFEDASQGGFYFTSIDHEQLLVRSKSFSDDAMPSGNGIAAQALLYLGLLNANTLYLRSAEKTLQAASAELNRQPMLYASLLNSLDSFLKPATIIILRGNKQAMRAWQQSVFAYYLPDVLCFAIADDVDLPPELKDKKMIGYDVCAYICEGTSCLPPVTELEPFQQYMQRCLNENP